jgi:hypothetical protein
MPRPTDVKKPLEQAIQRQQLAALVIQVEAKLLEIQKTLSEIGKTVPSPPTKPAS